MSYSTIKMGHISSKYTSHRVSVWEEVPVKKASDNSMKFIGIANRFWQVVSHGLFSTMYMELWRALLNLFSICSVHLRSEYLSGGGNLGCESSISDSDSFALQSLTAHLEITNSASQMENKRDTLCFEEIDPRRWQAGCQPVWLLYSYVSARLFFILLWKRYY